MASLLPTPFMIFERDMERLIQYWEMDGKISKHNDFANYLIGIMFRFKYRYLSITDIINYHPHTDKRVIYDETTAHLKEIKNQFNYYFNAIWC